MMYSKVLRRCALLTYCTFNLALLLYLPLRTVWARTRDTCRRRPPPLLEVCAHIRSVDPECPRFLSYRFSNRTGLGHKVSQVLFAWRMAEELRLTFAFDWAPFSTSVHHSYDWAVSYLGLSEGEVVSHAAAVQLYNLTVMRLCPYKSVPLTPLCRVLFVVSGDHCCGGNCFVKMGGVFDASKNCARAKHDLARVRVPSTVALSLHSDTVSVVWHVRVGDILLHAHDFSFFAEVWRALSEALYDVPVRNYFCSESSRELRAHFPFLPKLPNATFLTASDVATMHTFHSADVLVGSGSSFPLIAALVSDSFFFLNHIPKHPYGGVEFLADAAILLRNGTILLPVALMRLKIRQRVCRRRGDRHELCARLAT